MQKEYAAEIAGKLAELGLYADVDNGDNTLPKKIRNGEVAQYNFILGALRSSRSSDLLALTCLHVMNGRLNERTNER